jgi:hypothetical protein
MISQSPPDNEEQRTSKFLAVHSICCAVRLRVSTRRTIHPTTIRNKRRRLLGSSGVGRLNSLTVNSFDSDSSISSSSSIAEISCCSRCLLFPMSRGMTLSASQRRALQSNSAKMKEGKR